MINHQYVADHCISCGKCINKCLMLQQYSIDPKLYFKAYSTFSQDKTDSMIAYDCFMCGLCKVTCPKELDLGQAFLSIRNDIVQSNGGKTPIKALKSVNMHQNLSFNSLFTALNKGDS